ncbi:MAG: hypothetical protein HC796_05330 [Synechococcaceae cyanobacterium RL_1_2]|nr:hypothetical protein [Synechococcaceae cyanobacterium RL_1_2]
MILTTIAKILLLSIAISLGIKSSSHLGTVQGNNAIAIVMILTPSVILALLFWQRQSSPS